MHGYDRNCKGSQDAKVSAHPIPREEQSLIEALKLFVETSRLRVSQVAQLIGVGQSTLSRWLKGASRPSQKKISEIESFLHRHGKNNRRSLDGGRNEGS